MATLAVALARGLRAAQPLATDVPNGNLYFVTDEGVTEQSDGSAWVSYSGAGGSGTVTHTGALTASRVVVGNGTDDLKVLASLGTTTTVLHGNAAGLPTFGAVSLTADVSGVLPVVNGGTGSTGGAAILKASTTLTNAQIKALPTTPISLIAAPGAGFRIKPLSASLVMRATAAGYTNIDATYAAVVLMWSTPIATATWASNGIVNDTGTDPDLADLTYFLGSAQDTVYDLACPGLVSFANAVPGAQWTASYQPQGFVSSSENLALYLGGDNNGSGDWTGGNAANSLLVTVYYSIEALS